VKKPNKRATKVFIGLTAVLTLTAGALLAISPAPLRPDATSMLAVGPSVQPTAWQYIYLHHSRANRSVGQGDHFVIAPDGVIQATDRWERQLSPLAPVAGAKVNSTCVSIQFVGDFDQLPPTAAQLKAAQDLTGSLQQEYRIPAENVLMYPVSRSPASHGAKFPASAFRASLTR
jgi:hypothetical protein